MKHIPHRQDLVPASLQKAARSGMSWEDFSTGPGGHALRRAKAEEQGGLCAYCECRLTGPDGTLPPHVSHVDHFQPRNKGPHPRPDLTFDWDNMLLSCQREFSCGKHKDRQPIPADSIINPRREDPHSLIRFVLAGSAAHHRVFAIPRESQGPSCRRALDTIAALGLNCDALVNLRRDTWGSRYHDDVEALKQLSDDPDFLSLLAEDLRRQIAQGEFLSAMQDLAEEEIPGL